MWYITATLPLFSVHECIMGSVTLLSFLITASYLYELMSLENDSFRY